LLDLQCSGSGSPTVTRYRTSPRRKCADRDACSLPRERVRSSTQTGHDRLGLFNYLVGAGEDRRRDYEFTAQPKLGNGRGALERWPRKQALTIGRGAGTEQRGEVGLSHVVERIADRNVGERHPPRHQEVTTLQPLLE